MVVERLWFIVAALVLAQLACEKATNVYPPAFPDSPNAVTDPSRSTPQGGLDLRATTPRCDRDVPILDKRQIIQSYDVATEVTVTCPPGEVLQGSVYNCDERLRQRACVIGADATAQLVKWKTLVTIPAR